MSSMPIVRGLPPVSTKMLNARGVEWDGQPQTVTAMNEFLSALDFDERVTVMNGNLTMVGGGAPAGSRSIGKGGYLIVTMLGAQLVSARRWQLG